MRNQAVRRVERYLGLAVVLAGMSSAAGAQEVQTGLLVSTGVGVETNPYNEANSGGAQVAFTASLTPMARIRSERSTLDLTGSATFRQFLRRYGLEDNYNGDARLVTRVTEQVTLRTNAGFAYSESGYGGFGRPALGPLAPTVPIADLPFDPVLTDVAVLGQRTRIKSFDMGVGADTKLNAYSSLSLDLNGRSMRFGTAAFGDYDNVSGQLAYSHQLSEFTSIGVIGSVSNSDYINTRQGDARTYSGMLSVDHRLGSNWTLSASGGLASTRIKQLGGLPDTKFSSFTARLRFCRQGEFSQFCINGRRSPEPSANGSVRVTNTLEASYSLQVSDSERIGLSGAYAHTGRGRGPVALNPGVKFFNASASYDKTLTETIAAFASASFSKIYSSLAPRRANVGVNAGVRIRFGALQ